MELVAGIEQFVNEFVVVHFPWVDNGCFEFWLRMISRKIVVFCHYYQPNKYFNFISSCIGERSMSFT